VLWGLWFYYLTSSETQKGRDLGDQLLLIAHRAQNPALLLQAHHALAPTYLLAGDGVTGLAHSEQGIALYDPRQHREHAFLYGGHDPCMCCICHAAWSLWFLGYPDQALCRSREAISLARELSHPTTLAHAQLFLAMFHHFRREAPETQELGEAVVRLAAEQGLPTYWAGGSVLQGWALAEGGHAQEGIDKIHQGLAAWAKIPHFYWRINLLALLADAYGRGARAEEGLAVLDEALRAVEDTGARFYESEMHRLRGELLLTGAPKNPADAETCFRQAIAIAHGQSAKSLELRAVLSLSRLLQEQGKQDEARPMLSEIYGWFTEGFETADLQEAKALLQAAS
jgi:predicted ATPase